MGLRDIRLKRAYSSDTDDILHDFYVPALATSTEYWRLAGFFSSTSLAVAARGVVGLMRNGGSMKLLASPKLQQRDVEAIRMSTERPEKYVGEVMLAELETLEERFVRDHVSALGWMVANGRLKIKVAIVYDSAGKPLTYEGIEERGLFHPKVGVLTDRHGDSVTFSGSVNESAAAWLDNIEEFKVFRSWNAGEREYVEVDVSKFSRFWHGVPRRVEVMDIPQAVEKRLIQMAPANLEAIDLARLYNGMTRSERVELYEHQKAAIASWLENGKRGIFEMATGTGKTFTALGCLDRVSESADRVLAVVACPYGHLIEQWKREIDKFGIQYNAIIRADSSNRGWRDDLRDRLIDLSLGYDERLLVLTTHRTFSSNDFRRLVSENKAGFCALLIGDEVHGLGAEKSQEGLIEEYDLRLGLSATPRRWFDVPGTRAIYDFFGGIVYRFTLMEAINTINPTTGQTYLTPYRYLPQFVSLSAVELGEYNKHTKAIGARFSQTGDEEERDEILEMLLFRRANIIKNAEAKYEMLDDLLEGMSPLQWTIVYCSPQQIDRVMEIVNKHRIVAHRFTMDEGATPSQKYGGLSEREFILEKFGQAEYQVLVAMRCLDEGVDIPPARTIVLMASSGNPRQYIQRIGRVIRRYPGKTEASIHDIVVAPSMSALSPEVIEVENAVFDRELERYEYIAKAALNTAQALKLIYDVRSASIGG